MNDKEFFKILGLDKQRLSKRDRIKIKKDMRMLEDVVVRCVISDVYADEVKMGIISKEEAETNQIIRDYLALNKIIHPDK